MAQENLISDIKSIRLEDVSINYDDIGKGEVPIIFIHGFPFDKTSWDPQIKFFKEDHRIITYDIRGFGKSTAGKKKFEIALFADDLIMLMDSLNIQKAIVCGLSMGGYIVLNAVTRFPERFSAIILSDTQCIADSVEGKQKRYDTIEKIKSEGIYEFANGFISAVFCEKSKAIKKELVESVRTVILSTSKETIIQTLTALAERSETCSMLGNISVPALVICGKEDKVTPVIQSQSLANNINGSRLKTVEDAGHLSNLENSDEFNSAIFDFISKL